MSELTAFQKDLNSEYFTENRLKCDICNKTSKRVMQIETIENSYLACMIIDKKNKRFCSAELITRVLRDNKIVNMRMIVNETFEIKRKSVGLSLRYDVLNRDKFKCIACGKSAKNSVLEIDHIIPVSAGGKTEIGNLQTLCFECNRGKRNK